MRRIPVPILVTLAILLVGGPIGLLAGGRARHASAPPPTDRLADVARRAGCRLEELPDGSEPGNPPVTGRMVERILAADGSYAGRRAPGELATMHALLHGRVLLQYRADVGGEELRALDRLTRHDSRSVLLFSNQTGMRARIAATAYLSRMTCPRVDRATLGALAAFRDRRRDFGQSF